MSTTALAPRGTELPEREATDRDLVLAATTGDSGAFDVLYRRHADRAWRTACLIVGDAAVAEAVVADVFAHHLGTVPPNPPPERLQLRPILLRAVRRRALRHLEAAPHQTSVLRADASLVAVAFRSLPEVQRTALWLNAVERLRSAELATVLGIGAGAVPPLLARARAGLRRSYLKGSATPVGRRCERAVANLAASSAGTLSSAAHARVEAHVDGCPACRGRLTELRGIDLGASLLVIPAPVGLAASARAAWRAAQGLEAPVAAAGRRIVALQRPLACAAVTLFGLGVTGLGVLLDRSDPALGRELAGGFDGPRRLRPLEPKVAITTAPAGTDRGGLRVVDTVVADLPAPAAASAAAATPVPATAALPTVTTNPRPTAPAAARTTPPTATPAPAAPTTPASTVPTTPTTPTTNPPAATAPGATEVVVALPVPDAPVAVVVGIGDGSCTGATVAGVTIGCAPAAAAAPEEGVVVAVVVGGTKLL